MTEETNEAEQPNEEALKPQWLEPSPVGAQYVAHEQAMRLCREVPIDKAFAVAPGFNVGMLRRIAENYKPRKIVVIDHGENGFEVRRLGDFADTKLFYESLQPEKVAAMEDPANEQVEALKKAIRTYIAASGEEIAKYDPKCVDGRAAGCISYSYLQRKTVSLSCFKSDPRGATNAIKAALLQLEAEMVLQKLSSEEANEIMKSDAAAYRINRGAL